MTRGFIALILILHWSQGTEGGDDVIQKPVILWEPKNGSASLSCKHNKGSSYYQMYWYRQRPGETMRLIVFTVAGSDPEFGDVDKKKFEAQKSDAESGSLKVKDLDPDDITSSLLCLYFITAEILTLLQRADMMNAFLIRSACLLWLTVANHAKTVLQSPDDLVKSQTESAVIFCSHKIQFYDQMLCSASPAKGSGFDLLPTLSFGLQVLLLMAVLIKDPQI
ncbi:hypothetical protein G5714_017313 [Onychostoma macrolepis]|uniref:Immunoglobulin V-set domain-containing protein n=1 Tax=Onychostoma macrolepis TaxID=369639 RepID=A0A7J6C729_9TELE|nr:hypothetical protein G5714_017313 [Onychostoma macrolepis]